MWHRDPLTQFVAPGDHAFWAGQWQSPLFQAAMADPTDPYSKVIAWASTRPWWFIPLKHDYERYHFGAWFAQALGQREYETPLIHDLYLFHEILHARTFVDDPDSSEGNWRRRMRSDEILVSLETEVLVYARHPEWRAHSFSFPIWADRFDLSVAQSRVQGSLPGEPLRAERLLWEARPQGNEWPIPFIPTSAFGSEGELWARRRQAAIAPLAADSPEALIALYDEQAAPFFEAWRPHWREVEQERVAFERLCAQGHWHEAVQRRERHWERVSDEDGIPYGQIAKATYKP